MTKASLSKILIVALALVVAGCGSLIELPNSGDAPALYNLTALQSPGQSGSDQLLMIEDLVTSGGLDVRNIARRPSPNEMQYFAGARWTTRTSAMVQALLTESFQNAGQHVSSGRGGAVAPPKFELQIELRDFQAEFYGGGNVPVIHVRMALKLLQLVPIKVIETTVIDVRREAYGASMAAVIDAFDDANHDAMSRVIDFVAPLITSHE